MITNSHESHSVDVRPTDLSIEARNVLYTFSYGNADGLQGVRLFFKNGFELELLADDKGYTYELNSFVLVVTQEVSNQTDEKTYEEVNYYDLQELVRLKTVRYK